MTKLDTTRRQRLIASGRLVDAWQLTFAVVGSILAVWWIGLSYAFSSMWIVLLLLVAVVLAFITGFFVSVPFALFVFGPICYDQSVKNGGPFEPGDLVQIIYGPHQDQVGRIYSHWQQDTLRVELGDEAREQYKDIFASYQLLRVEERKASEAGQETISAPS